MSTSNLDPNLIGRGSGGDAFLAPPLGVISTGAGAVVTMAGVPVSRRIHLFRHDNRIRTRVEWSDTSGNFSFSDLNTGARYDVLAEDNTGNYNDVIVTRVQPYANPMAPLRLAGTFGSTSRISAAFSQQILISGGSGSYSNARVLSGSLPSGFTLSIALVSSQYYLQLTGTFSSSVTSYTFTAAVDSSDGQTVSATQTLRTINYLSAYVSPLVAWSLDKVISTYGGSAIRVRRASDNTEQDIGFVTGGFFDASSLATFCAGTTGYVKTIYDQVGSNNQTQTTTGNQLLIYDAFGFRGFIFGDGAARCIISGTVTYTQPKITVFANMSYIKAGASGSSANVHSFIGAGYTFVNSGWSITYDGRSATYTPNLTLQYGGTSGGSFNTMNYVGAAESPTIFSVLFDNTSSTSAGQFTFWLNGSIQTQVGAGSSTIPASATMGAYTVCLFGDTASPTYWSQGTLKTLIICDGDVTAQRTNVEASL